MVDIKESGKGIGSSIIDEALNVFKREGYVKVRLAYMKGNPQSSRFWQKCGFAETGIEKENEHGVAVVLEKIIWIIISKEEANDKRRKSRKVV